ncbi:lysylphosphatidylglycerol synthase domain-containing protein [Rhizobium grahamii]|nr:lysylphosphatidylglycerol synthase domain-containing protein [Rhizobium grahamii]
MTAKRIFINLTLVFGLLLAAYLVYKVFNRYSPREIMESMGAIPKARLMASLGFCALSYLCLTGFDWMALRYAGKPLTYPRAAIGSFTGLSIGHNLGVAALSSGAVRYRFYSRWGLDTQEVAKVILFCGVTVGIGLSTLAGLALLVNPGDASNLLHIGSARLLWMGIFCLSVPVVYVILAGMLRSELKLWRWSFEMPNVRLALGQVIIGTLNFVFVAACLHQLLSASGDASFIQTATAFVLANLAILITHVPGGLGVLEATVNHVLPGNASIGALVAFRVIYFLLPLMVGLIVLGISELILRKRKIASTVSTQDATEAQAQSL